MQDVNNAFKMLKKMYKDVERHLKYFEATTKSWKKVFFDLKLNKIEDLEKFQNEQREAIEKQVVQLWNTIAIFSSTWEQIDKCVYDNEAQAKEIADAYSKMINHTSNVSEDEHYFNTIKEYFTILFWDKITFDDKNMTFNVFWDENMKLASFLMWTGLLDYIQTLSTINLKDIER